MLNYAIESDSLLWDIDNDWDLEYSYHDPLDQSLLKGAYL